MTMKTYILHGSFNSFANFLLDVVLFIVIFLPLLYFGFDFVLLKLLEMILCSPTIKVLIYTKTSINLGSH